MTAKKTSCKRKKRQTHCSINDCSYKTEEVFYLVKQISNRRRWRRWWNPFICAEMKLLGYSHMFLSVAENPQFPFTLKYLPKRETSLYTHHKRMKYILSTIRKSQKIQTFLFSGFALNLGAFINSSNSSSAELLTLVGRALRNV